MSALKNKHVVVSGGGTGVGAELARAYVLSGAKVSILGRRLEPLQIVADDIGAKALSCDVTDRSAVDYAIEEARKVHGPISIAIANAGSANSKPFSAMTPEDVSFDINVNLMGTFNLWQASLADMKIANWGRMIAIASTAALKGYGYVSGYCAAKHAVLGLTRSLSLELAKTGITVNSICPGFIETPMLESSIKNIVEKTGMSEDDAAKSLKAGNPMKRFIQTDEIASTAIWLSSAGARSINGQAISVNGGEI
jgi:3-hydroxybutyrate dehydrogenase